MLQRYPALNQAAFKGHSAIVSYLLRMGADLERRSKVQCLHTVQQCGAAVTPCPLPYEPSGAEQYAPALGMRVWAHDNGRAIDGQGGGCGGEEQRKPVASRGRVELRKHAGKQSVANRLRYCVSTLSVALG